MIHGGGRINTALPQDTPIHEHHPFGRCKKCLLWSPTKENPTNLGLCLATYREYNSDWSCKLFVKGR